MQNDECLIREFLTKNLKLELNSKTQIFKSSQGVNFCGYKINEYRLKIRTKGKKKLKNKIKKLKYQIKTKQIDTKEAHKFSFPFRRRYNICKKELSNK